jgi:hypothetical protein
MVQSTDLGPHSSGDIGSSNREIEPVTALDLERFLHSWQHVAPGSALHGADGTHIPQKLPAIDKEHCPLTFLSGGLNDKSRDSPFASPARRNE